MKTLLSLSSRIWCMVLVVGVLTLVSQSSLAQTSTKNEETLILVDKQTVREKKQLNLAAGEAISVEGTGLKPESKVEVILMSGKSRMGFQSYKVRPEGNFEGQMTLPKKPFEGTIIVNYTNGRGVFKELKAPVEVVE